MDINYHYFAVKTLADLAGFPGADSQRIASYSQFIDDYDIYASLTLDSVPVFAEHLAKKKGNRWKFYPITTGFNSLGDMSRLLFTSKQLAITVPFHFIPPVQYTGQEEDRSKYRTIPASLSTPSLMQSMLVDARTEYHRGQGVEAQRQLCLMKIGMLLHTFADTYAHQNFSGFYDWENHAKLTRAQDLIPDPDQDILNSYSPVKYRSVPSIGHANLNHAPDDTNIELGWSQKTNKDDKNYSLHYQRSNIREFCIVSREIVNYLRSCINADPISDTDWNAFVPNLVRGFKTTSKDPKVLSTHWHTIFPNITYSYNKTPMLNSILTVVSPTNDEDGNMLQSAFYTADGEPRKEMQDDVLFTTKSDDFFYYNVFADHIRHRVNGLANDVNFAVYLADIEAKNKKMSDSSCSD